MESWVRSQDKKLLLQAKEVKLDVFVGKKLYNNKTNEIIFTFDGEDTFYTIRVNGNVVGEYETKERCLEILDEIQYLICLLNKHNLSPEEQINEGVCYLPNEDKTLSYCKVYQMPEK